MTFYKIRRISDGKYGTRIRSSRAAWGAGKSYTILNAAIDNYNRIGVCYDGYGKPNYRELELVEFSVDENSIFQENIIWTGSRCVLPAWIIDVK